ncbi:AaceriAGL070Wp [[Ashbya] aceris (nom. inval.)]|nr:AaceriAGL070Wp [[Ashbya] aceris (nom. inval.)]
MNSLSYLTGATQHGAGKGDGRWPGSERGLAKVKEEQDAARAGVGAGAAWVWRVLFFLPKWLVVKPVVLVWFVLTFPLSLIEQTSSKEADGTAGLDAAEEERLAEPVEDDDLVGESMVLQEDSVKSSRPSTSRSSYTSTRLGKFLFPKKLIPQSILQTDRKKVLVLDLDETLIHSMSRSTSSVSNSQGHMVEVTFAASGVSTLYYVHKRPYCDLFLSRVSKWYDLVIFTASMKEYADPVIDWLESGISVRFSQRRYRSDCILRDGVGYVKDLSIISKNLQDIIIVDNSPISYAMNVDNAIQVEGWISDPTDTGLLNLLPLLEGLRFTTDTRNILSLKNGERAFI